MAKATRIKASAALYPVPQSRDDVNDAIAKIGLAQRERARIQADMNDQLAKVKQHFEDEAKPFNELEALFGVSVCSARNEDLLHTRVMKRRTKRCPIDLSIVYSHRDVLIHLVLQRALEFALGHNRKLDNGREGFV